MQCRSAEESVLLHGKEFLEVPFSKIIDNQQEKVKNIYEQSSKQRFFIIDNFPFSLYK